MKKSILFILLFAATLANAQYQIVTISPLPIWEFQNGELVYMKSVGFEYGAVVSINTKSFAFGGLNIGANFQTTITPNISLVLGIGEDLFAKLKIPALLGYGFYDAYDHDFGIGGGINLYNAIFGTSSSNVSARMRENNRYKYNSLIN